MGHEGLRHRAFRIEWDDLGCFLLFDVPVLFPRSRRSEGLSNPTASACRTKNVELQLETARVRSAAGLLDRRSLPGRDSPAPGSQSGNGRSAQNEVRLPSDLDTESTWDAYRTAPFNQLGGILYGKQR